MSKMKSDNQISPASLPPLRRKKEVRPAVLFFDRMAGRIITTGGIMVIIAVLGILVFLIHETLPLFSPADISDVFSYEVRPSEDPDKKSILTAGTDEYRSMAFIITGNGKVGLFHASTGTVLLSSEDLSEGKEITAFSMAGNGKNLILGFSDGTIRLATIDFPSDILSGKELPLKRVELSSRDSFEGEYIFSKIPGNQYRRIRFRLEKDEFIQVTEAGIPIIALDYEVRGEAERGASTFAVVDRSNTAYLVSFQTKMNLLSGKKSMTMEKTVLPPIPEKTEIHSVLLTGTADMVIIAEKNGKFFRYNVQDPENPYLAEGTNLLSREDQITLADFLIGSQSIVVGTQKGFLDIFFLSHAPSRGTPDGYALVKARSFLPFEHAPILFNASMRNKSFAVGLENNDIHVLHGTSQKEIARFSGKNTGELSVISLTPRFDGLISLDREGKTRLFEFSVPHPETTFKTLFRKVWYEGYEKPTYTWQSSAGSDDYEPKLSLIPLIFGSIKAAFYSLLLSIPIAILGAVYTSEFVDKKIRNIVKPAMEMMASLPSVVLGFVAALVLAPVVENFIFAVILSFAFIPAALIVGALLFQFLPVHLNSKLDGMPKFIFTGVFILISTVLSGRYAPLLERILFNGNFKSWLNRDAGDGTPFLFLILIPMVFLGLSFVFSRYFTLKYQNFLKKISPLRGALIDMLKWLMMTASALSISYLAAKLFALAGMDLRDGFVGTYVQRNTLIVGFAMGFAVIPIIYTISEDALSAVPSHLRAASLGCGATTWQTAIYVVLPTAASGVFSAIMVGMGRAVGETMIIVMAAGNTPLIDLNIFSGLRSLSATIAVELPEAVKGGTLYRVLFLSGLVLFFITFIINTIAEIVRLKFRKRATQL